MSKIKHPIIKKKLCYAHDCRNNYGENDKSSRKNIRKNKRNDAQVLRSSLTQMLSSHTSIIDIHWGEYIDIHIKSAEKLKRRQGFKKVSDIPLANYLKCHHKMTR